LQSVVVDPLVFESEMPYRSRAAELGFPDEATLRMIQLASGSILAKKAAIEASMKTGEMVPLEFLDTAAQYCAENGLEPLDEIADDANAWMVRLLVERGGPRYIRLIKSMNKSKGSRTYRQSIAPVRNVDGITRERFEPGSVSLAEKAAKYPSLYPKVTYWSGRL
jgi:hypothetical protein